MLPTMFRVNWPFGSGKEAVTQMLPTKFRVIWPFGSEEVGKKTDFQFTASFDLQVTPMLPTKFRVNWPLGSGEEAKYRFSRRPLSERV